MSVRRIASAAYVFLIALACVMPAQLCAQHAMHSNGTVDSAGRQHDSLRLGSVTFPNSGAPRAQQAFLRGVAMLYSFGDPGPSFREAERLDPNFALAYWGDALTHRWDQGGREDTTGARATLERLGSTHTMRAAKAHTARERAYLDAVELLFGMPDSGTSTARSPDTVFSGTTALRGQRIDSVRITRYVEAMRLLHERFPADDNASVLYALALLNRRNLEWFDPDRYLRTSVEMGAILEDVFRRLPDHPGAAHLLIHAYDHGLLAPLGVRAARAYASIAPDMPHALHMPSHIFIRDGLWDEVARSNEQAMARHIAESGTKVPKAEDIDWHFADFLQYAYLQQGRWRLAKALADSADVLAKRSTPEDRKNWLDEEVKDLTGEYVAETGLWNAFPAVSHDLVRAAYRRGDARKLDSIARALDTAAAPTAQWQRSKASRLSLIRSLSAGLAGNRDSSIAGLTSLCTAASRDPGRFMGEGPRTTGDTSCELAGEMLLARGRPAEALTSYDAALADIPGHWIAMLGRARALSCMGDASGARAAYGELLVQWAHADADLPALAEVRSGAAGMKEQHPQCKTVRAAAV